MGLLNRRKSGPPPSANPAPVPPAAERAPGPAAEIDLERPLLSLVYALRTWGQHEPRVSADVASAGEGEEREAPPLEQWARRAFTFSEGARVDFDSLDRFVLTHRSEEQRAIERSMRDLREALWVFAECYSKSLSQDASGDEKSLGSVERLRKAVAAGEVAAIRREAVLTAQTISSVISSRQERQRDQIDRLAAKLEDVSSALIRAKRDGERDPLSGLFNRAAFDAHLKRMADLAVFMPNAPLLMVLDIDHFKWVNDRFGHAVGDLAIRSVAVRLAATCRRGEDFLARFGGDEFVGILDGVSPGAEAAQADRILFAIREIEIPLPNETLRLSCSLGLARARPGEAPLEWFQRGDGALYQAKRAGRDRSFIAGASAPEEATSD